MRLHKEKFHVHEAEATIQRSLWESNLHKTWQPIIKNTELFKHLGHNLAMPTMTYHSYSLPFNLLSSSFHYPQVGINFIHLKKNQTQYQNTSKKKSKEKNILACFLKAKETRTQNMKGLRSWYLLSRGRKIVIDWDAFPWWPTGHMWDTGSRALQPLRSDARSQVVLYSLNLRKTLRLLHSSLHNTKIPLFFHP